MYEEHTERWQSGRMRLTRNQLCPFRAPGVRISLSPPLKTKKHPCGVLFVFKRGQGDENSRKGSSTTSERQTRVCRSAKPMSAVNEAVAK